MKDLYGEAMRKVEAMSRVLGITGNIASGKTTVGKILLSLGAKRYIDADALVHQLYEPGTELTVEIGRLFGEDVVTAEGRIDRRALGAIVFADEQAMKRLEAIVHPAVGKRLEQELMSAEKDDIIVIDAVKLIEGVSGRFTQSKWLIISNEEQQKKRLQTRNNLSEEEALRRIAAQPALAGKEKLVDEVIDNSGTFEETKVQVEEAFKRFCQR